MNKKYKILIFSGPYGHQSIGQAANDFLIDIPNVDIKTINFYDNLQTTSKAFVIIYRYLPFLFKIPFEISKNPNAMKMIKNHINDRKGNNIIKILKKENPDIVINVFWEYIPVLDKVKRSHKFKLINIITDPVNFHPILISHEADYNFSFGKSPTQIAKKYNINKNKIITTGWLVRKNFFKSHNTNKIRKKLDIKNDLTFLICGGSEGTSGILSILPVLFLTKFSRPLQIIFINGHNKKLSGIINKLYKAASKINPKIPKIIIKNFTDRMDKYMSVSDLVIGKAGPNLIFESVASKKPFIAISHISGHEDGNLKMIEKYNIGWVAEDMISFNKIIKKIISNPKILENKRQYLNKLAEFSYEAGVQLRKKVIELRDSKL